MGSCDSFENDIEMTAQQQVLDMKMTRLLYIHTALHKIYKDMSVDGRWEYLASTMGLCLNEIELYKCLLSTKPGQLPARTFLEKYYIDRHCTLKHLLRALLLMGQTDNTCIELAEDLWNAALYGNSPYYQQ